MGNRRRMAVCLQNQARAKISMGDLRSVPALAIESMEIATENNFRMLLSNFCDIMVGLEAGRGNWDLAARFYGVTEARNKELNYRREPADEAYIEPIVQQIRENLDSETFQAAYDAGQSLNEDDPLAEIGKLLASEPS